MDDGVSYISEMDVDLDNLAEIKENHLNKAVAYSPVYERNLRHTLNSGDYALRKIKKGEEIMTDYLSYIGDSDSLKEDIEL